MKNPLNIRQNFYQGQSVSASNLTQLQDYSDNARNLIVSDILGYGIVSGFDTTKAKVNNFTLSIGSGLAYTKNGVRLETTAPKELFIKDFIKSTDLPSGETIITRYLAMSLDYDKTKPITDSFSNSVETVWTPTATPVLYAQVDLITMNDILLAEIQINEYGTTEIIDRRKDFLDFNALTQKTSSFTTTKEEANTIASIDADIFNINNKSFVDTIRDTSYPIKSTYTQYPNDTTGKFDVNESPTSLFGGTWEKLFTSKSVFFRTQKITSDTDRVNGVQLDAMQRLTGKFEAAGGDGYGWVASGVIGMDQTGNKGDFANRGGTANYNQLLFDNSYQARTSTENRPINMEVIVWKKIG